MRPPSRNGLGMADYRARLARKHLHGLRGWRLTWRLALIALIVAGCVVLASLLAGCAGTVATYRDGAGQRVWQMSGATAGSKLPEGSNQLSVTVLDDGTSELVMGGVSQGAEAAAIPPEVLQWLLSTALRSALPVPQLGDTP